MVWCAALSQPGYVTVTLQDVSRIFTLFFQYSNNANDKRVKTNGPLGLLAGWKKSLAKEHAKTIKGEWIFINSYSIVTCLLWEFTAQNISNSNASSNKAVKDEDRDPLEYARGEFDADEPAEIIQAARISKAKVSVHTGGVYIIHSSNWWTLTI